MITEMQKQVEEFIGENKNTTDKRKRTFESLFSFVLDGQQWTSEELTQRDADDIPSLIFNFSEDYVTRYMAKLFPRSSRTGVLEVGAKIYNDDKGDKIDEVLTVYRRNYLPAILLEQGVNFLIGGAACFYYPQDSITRRALIYSANPKNCYLGWDAGELVRFAYVQELDKNLKKIFYCDKQNLISIDEKNILIHEKNKFGFLPVSWIPNNPKPHTREGISKILSLYNLDREQNFRLSDFAKRVEENTDPHLVIFSDNAKKEEFARGRKKISQVGKDDDARYLEVKESPEVIEFADIIDNKMSRKTGLVDSAGGIKSAVSGLSLSFQYSDMHDMIGFMRVFWDKAFRELNNAILNYKFGASIYETDPVYNPSIVFDSKQRVEEYDIMLRNKLISRRDAIDELRGVENADEKILEILAEDKLFQASLSQKNDQSKGNNPNRRGPSAD
ncbi:phage portal protein [Candidatus Parcubacteria bacterium]|nr:phage portal protein [Patescibacteria group bacterium]MCG2699115.1 phage portal protein [Candidatus Parcubacteria bacterium]